MAVSKSWGMRKMANNSSNASQNSNRAPVRIATEEGRVDGLEIYTYILRHKTISGKIMSLRTAVFPGIYGDICPVQRTDGRKRPSHEIPRP